MKKFMMMLLSLSFVGTTAMAFEGAFVPNEDGATVQPLRGICPAKPVKNGNYCKPVGNSCPSGYDQFAKLCWGGWKKGFYKCGISCKPKEQCGWNPHGDYRCGNPGYGPNPGHHFSAISGVLKLNEEGAVELKAAKNICEVQGSVHGDNDHWTVCRPADGVNCAPGYKRMNKYCIGNWKKPLYRCGYVCEKSRNANDDGNGGGIN
ncbi:hypothetical protein [Bdellovibrio sp. KM01]|uniref:hypothetical protein n=1 Tax=Bdellovibrio sp. KM01 TaxID=2748865 RepID=UPI0015EA66E8|nr:hypothetical protein [Bdellovibrio sp. KM01]QLY26935.1 hypothetical protein HW988_08055 [Bdellovibrio sp. KM01]